MAVKPMLVVAISVKSCYNEGMNTTYQTQLGVWVSVTPLDINERISFVVAEKIDNKFIYHTLSTTLNDAIDTLNLNDDNCNDNIFAFPLLDHCTVKSHLFSAWDKSTHSWSKYIPSIEIYCSKKIMSIDWAIDDYGILDLSW